VLSAFSEQGVESLQARSRSGPFSYDSNLPLKHWALFFVSAQINRLDNFGMAHPAFPPNIFCVLASPLRLLDALGYDYGLNPFISNPGGCSLAALQLNPLQCPQGTDLKGKRSQTAPVFRKEGRHGNLLCHTLVSLSITADLANSLRLTGGQEVPPPTQVQHGDATTLLHRASHPGTAKRR